MILRDREKYDFEIKRHAFIRAMQRGIRPELIEATLKGGRVKKFGKNSLKFIGEYKRFRVICIDEILGDKIKIVTIERKNKLWGWLK